MVTFSQMLSLKMLTGRQLHSPTLVLLLYTTVSRSDLSVLGQRAYQQFDQAFMLTRVMRQAGEDPEQTRFQDR